MTEIAPAILTNDLSDFRHKYAELFALSHHFKTLHIDFIDGEFLPNKTLLPADLEFLKSSPFLLTAHLMVKNPQQYFQGAKDSGFECVIFHFEVFKNPEEIKQAIEQAKSLGLKPGLALNPETPLRSLVDLPNQVGLVQLMGVHPGSQGQEFVPEVLDKVRQLRLLSKSVIISVDGGIKVGLAHKLVAAGADILVAGSAILKSEDEEKAIEALRADIETK